MRLGLDCNVTTVIIPSKGNTNLLCCRKKCKCTWPALQSFITSIISGVFKKKKSLFLSGHVHGNKRHDKSAVTRENRSSGFPTRSDRNQPVQLQIMARTLKFWI